MRDDGMNPRLLLVEDDPVSRTFLAEAARALPAEVDEAGSIAEASKLAMSNGYDAWLIDAHLPDGSGIDLLISLRAATRMPWPYALAHTAARSNDDLAALRDAGFDAAIAKPLPVAEWQSAILSGLAVREGDACWDDAAALRALNGNIGSMEALRGLFRAELPKQQRAISDALDAGDTAAVLAELHRLKASCGFVGASRLLRAAEALHASPASRQARISFDAAVQATLASGSGVV